MKYASTVLIHLEPEICIMFFCIPIFHQTTYNLYLTTLYIFSAWWEP